VTKTRLCSSSPIWCWCRSDRPRRTLRAVAATVALLQQTGRPFLFVLNQVTLNANITAEAAAALSHHGRVARTIIPSRVGYPAAMTDGHTAPELAPRGPAATEIARLWGDIKARMHATMLTTQGAPTHAQGG
jgi:chromosome partitioning protein